MLYEVITQSNEWGSRQKPRVGGHNYYDGSPQTRYWLRITSYNVCYTKLLRPFVRLMQAHAISVAGDASVAASLAGSLFFAQPTSAARSDILLYLLLTMAPFAVLSPVMGPILDRFRGGRRIMVIISCLGRAVLCLAMVQFIIQPSPEGLLIYPLAFGVLVLQKTYSIAKAALVPAIVTDSSSYNFV